MLNKILIFDDACSLCQGYANFLLKYKFIQPKDLFGYSQLPTELLAKLDLNKSCVEMPMIDTSTNQVYYGIDTILEIISLQFAFVKTIGNYKYFHWILDKIYKTISYNRKGIIATIPKQKSISCTPMFNYNYKMFFISICYIVATIIMFCFYKKHFKISSNIIFWLSGLIVLFSIFIKSKKYLEFSFQWQLQLMIMSVLLIPSVYIYHYTSFGSLLYCIIISTLFIKQIWQRIKYLQYLFSI